jgi:hypothetical protein
LRTPHGQIINTSGWGSDTNEVAQSYTLRVVCAPQVNHLAIEYAADLTPVVAGKKGGASWNARGMENALDF